GAAALGPPARRRHRAGAARVRRGAGVGRAHGGAPRARPRAVARRVAAAAARGARAREARRRDGARRVSAAAPARRAAGPGAVPAGVPAVSVVIVAYHSRDPLAACLESLAAHAGALAVETIVVDNASGDGTVEWLAAAHPRARCVANADNAGFTRGVN